MVFLKLFFEKVNFEKNSIDYKESMKNINGVNLNLLNLGMHVLCIYKRSLDDMCMFSDNVTNLTYRIVLDCMYSIALLA